MFVRHRAAKGAALVELTFALPLLVAVLVGTADFARVFYYSIELINAARSGAQYGSYNSARAADTAGITLAAENAAPTIAPITVVSIQTVCQCATSDGSGQPWAVITCGNTCSSGLHQFETVTVTTQKVFSPISRFVPAIPNSITLTRKATLRVPL